MVYVILILLTLLPSCSINITLVHTDGTATDVVDDAATTSAKVDPTLTIPATTV